MKDKSNKTKIRVTIVLLIAAMILLSVTFFLKNPTVLDGKSTTTGTVKNTQIKSIDTNSDESMGNANEKEEKNEFSNENTNNVELSEKTIDKVKRDSDGNSIIKIEKSDFYNTDKDNKQNNDKQNETKTDTGNKSNETIEIDESKNNDKRNETKTDSSNESDEMIKIDSEPELPSFSIE